MASVDAEREAVEVEASVGARTTRDQDPGEERLSVEEKIFPLKIFSKEWSPPDAWKLPVCYSSVGYRYDTSLLADIPTMVRCQYLVKQIGDRERHLKEFFPVEVAAAVWNDISCWHFHQSTCTERENKNQIGLYWKEKVSLHRHWTLFPTSTSACTGTYTYILSICTEKMKSWHRLQASPPLGHLCYSPLLLSLSIHVHRHRYSHYVSM